MAPEWVIGKLARIVLCAVGQVAIVEKVLHVLGQLCPTREDQEREQHREQLDGFS